MGAEWRIFIAIPATGNEGASISTNCIEYNTFSHFRDLFKLFHVCEDGTLNVASESRTDTYINAGPGLGLKLRSNGARLELKCNEGRSSIDELGILYYDKFKLKGEAPDLRLAPPSEFASFVRLSARNVKKFQRKIVAAQQGQGDINASFDGLEERVSERVVIPLSKTRVKMPQDSASLEVCLVTVAP